MDKGSLGVAGLVAGVLGVLVGGFAYMQAGKALSTAGKALSVVDEAPWKSAGADEIRKAVNQQMEATKAEIGKMVTEVRGEIRKLEEQAQSSDILLEAKRHADSNASRASQELMAQVRSLKEEIASGDQETKSYYDEIKASLEEKIEKSEQTLKNLITRWLESGTM